MNRPCIAILSLFVLLLGGCLFSSDGSVPVRPRGVEKVIGPYRVEGNKIIVPQRIKAVPRCMSDYPDTTSRLVTEYDTSEADTNVFELSAGKMVVYSSYVDTLPSGATLLEFTTLTRIGSGSGVEGLWGFTSSGYRVLSGTLSDSEKTKEDSRAQYQNKRYADGTELQVLFSNGILTEYDISKPAEVFAAGWNGDGDVEYPQYADSARYDIALRIVDDSTVELTGKLTGETVRITLSPGANLGERSKRVYSSSDPAHAPYTYSNPPNACPDPYEPRWYLDFLGTNARKLPGAPKMPVPRPRLRNGMPISSPRTGIRSVGP